MPWLALTGLAVMCRSSLSIGSKLVTNRVAASSLTLSALLTGFGAVLALLLSPVLGGLSVSGLAAVWPSAVVMVLSQGVGNILYFEGVARLDAGTTQIAFSTIVLWSLGLSVLLLDSSFSPMQLLGVALLVGAILLAGHGPVDAERTTGVLFIVASTAMYGTFQVTSAQLSRHVSAATYLVLTYAGATALLLALYARRIAPELRAVSASWRRTLPVTLYAAASSMGAFTFGYFAYRVAPDRGLVVVLLTTQVVLSVLLGIVLLGERERAGRKIAAGVIAVLATWLIYV